MRRPEDVDQTPEAARSRVLPSVGFSTPALFYLPETAFFPCNVMALTVDVGALVCQKQVRPGAGEGRGGRWTAGARVQGHHGPPSSGRSADVE